MDPRSKTVPYAKPNASVQQGVWWLDFIASHLILSFRSLLESFNKNVIRELTDKAGWHPPLPVQMLTLHPKRGFVPRTLMAGRLVQAIFPGLDET